MRRFSLPTLNGFIVVSLCSVFAIGCSGDSPERLQFKDKFPEVVEQWTPVRIPFDLGKVEGNPYDPGEYDVQLKIVSPDGTTASHPAFFMHDYDVVFDHGREVARDTGQQHWEIRWTPTQSGTYEWELVAQTKATRHKLAGKVTCTPSQKPGFVKLSSKDPQYFEFSDGSFFYPLGHVTRSPSDVRWRNNKPENVKVHEALLEERSFAYERWFEKMKANNENFCSLWMTPWWLGIEWSTTYPGYEGLGRYNQIHAAQLDRILAAAERNGIYILLFVTNHGQISSVTDTEWDTSPYRKENGGPAETASQFMTNQECERKTQHRLRYILARWGYSPALFGISISTETDWADLYNGHQCDRTEEVIDGRSYPNHHIPKDIRTVNAWLRRISDYIREVDIHDHLVTTQFSMPDSGHDLWKMPEFDVALNNCYLSAFPVFYKYAESSGGAAEALFGWTRLHDVGKKPKLLAEWGGSHMQNTSERLATDLHAGLWSIAMTDCGGTTGYWWWNEIDDANLYGDFNALHRFLSGYDRRGKHLKSRQGRVAKKLDLAGNARFASHPTRSALVLSNETELFAYVYHRLMNSGLIAPASPEDPRFELSKDSYLQIPEDIREGKYKVEFWNTTLGEISETREIVLQSPGETPRYLELLPLRIDVAIKLIRQTDE